MPLPTPESTDRVEAPLMTSKAKMIPTIMADPSSIARPPIPMRVRPATNCYTPSPSVCATPRIVATTATISMMCPKVPDSALPNKGVKAERIVSGKPRR